MKNPVLSIEKQIDCKALRRELKIVASINNNHISREEREKLIVRKAVSHLPTVSRIVIFLRFWENQSLSEIAEVVALSTQEVREIYLTSIKYLEKELSPYFLKNDFFMSKEVPQN